MDMMGTEKSGLVKVAERGKHRGKKDAKAPAPTTKKKKPRFDLGELIMQDMKQREQEKKESAEVEENNEDSFVAPSQKQNQVMPETLPSTISRPSSKERRRGSVRDNGEVITQAMRLDQEQKMLSRRNRKLRKEQEQHKLEAKLERFSFEAQMNDASRGIGSGAPDAANVKDKKLAKRMQDMQLASDMLSEATKRLNECELGMLALPAEDQVPECYDELIERKHEINEALRSETEQRLQYMNEKHQSQLLRAETQRDDEIQSWNNRWEQVVQMFEQEVAFTQEELRKKQEQELLVSKAQKSELLEGPPQYKPSADLRNMLRIEGMLVKHKDFVTAQRMRAEAREQGNREIAKYYQDCKDRVFKEARKLQERQRTELMRLQDRVDSKREAMLQQRELDLQAIMHRYQKRIGHLNVIQGEELARGFSKMMTEARVRGVSVDSVKHSLPIRKIKNMSNALQLPPSLERAAYTIPRPPATHRDSRISHRSHFSRKLHPSGSQTERGRPPPMVSQLKNPRGSKLSEYPSEFELPAVARVQLRLPNIARRSKMIVVRGPDRPPQIPAQQRLRSPSRKMRSLKTGPTLGSSGEQDGQQYQCSAVIADREELPEPVPGHLEGGGSIDQSETEVADAAARLINVMGTNGQPETDVDDNMPSSDPATSNGNTTTDNMKGVDTKTLGGEAEGTEEEAMGSEDKGTEEETAGSEAQGTEENIIINQEP